MPLTLVKPPQEPVTDAQLAAQIASGDRRALEALMRRYNQRLYRVARSVLRNEADAEEAVQDAFFLAYRAMDKFRADSKLSTWLVRIVINESNRRLRKNKRLSTWLEFTDDAEYGNETAETGMNDFSSNQPQHAAAQLDTRHLLEAGIDQLPSLFRAVFVLRAVEEMTVEETAACLNIPAATVRTRYFRARGLLRKSLARELGHSLTEAFAFAGERCDRIVAGVLARIDEWQSGQV